MPRELQNKDVDIVNALHTDLRWAVGSGFASRHNLPDKAFCPDEASKSKCGCSSRLDSQDDAGQDGGGMMFSGIWRVTGGAMLPMMQPERAHDGERPVDRAAR